MLSIEQTYRNKTASNPLGLGTSQVAGGVQTVVPGGSVPTGQTEGLPGQTGRESRGHNRENANNWENTPNGRGVSDREPVSTTKGGRSPELVEGPYKTDTRDRKKPQDLVL